MAQAFEVGKVLDRFFERRAISAISPIPFFKFGEVVWGGGHVNRINDELVIDSPLPNIVNNSNIIGEFARTEAVYTYDPITKLIKGQATIAKGSLPAEVNAEFTTLYILDGEYGVVALAVGMPVIMNRTRGMTVEFTLDTRRPIA